MPPPSRHSPEPVRLARSAPLAGASPDRVFVVTPSFNQARYLRAAIDSVLAQDHPHVDHFVADAGSTDGTIEILRSYGDRVRWRSGPDGGQAAVVADAWAASDADVVAWLNSDDVYLPGAVSRAVAYLREHPAAGMVYGKAWFVDERGEKLREYPTLPFDAERLRTECFICQPAAFVRRSVCDRVGLPDRALRYCMDYDFWIRLSREFEAGYLDRHLARSRVHSESKSQRELAAMFDEIERVTARAWGVAPRNWAVASMIHRAKLRLRHLAVLIPARLRARLQASLVQRLEAAYRGPLFSDLWAGSATTVVVRKNGEERVRLRAESPYWPYAEPLAVTVELGGETLARRTVDRRGAFELDFDLPPGAAGGRSGVEVLLRANRTFVPQVAGYSPWDERPLSFLVR